MKKLLLILAMVSLVQNMVYADEGWGKGKRFEENKGRILEIISKKIEFLNNFNSCNSVVNVGINLSVSNRHLASTVERELMHVADHAVHHGHIIQIIIKNEFHDLDLSVEFYSPSTLEHMKCVQ